MCFSNVSIYKHYLHAYTHHTQTHTHMHIHTNTAQHVHTHIHYMYTHTLHVHTYTTCTHIHYMYTHTPHVHTHKDHTHIHTYVHKYTPRPTHLHKNAQTQGLQYKFLYMRMYIYYYSRMERLTASVCLAIIRT